jgi:hypothetical protein
MKTVLLLSLSVLIAVVIACRPVETLTNDQSLKPGDEINGMIVTTGADQSPPLSSFCSTDLKDTDSSSINCQVPPLPSLAIGHTLGLADRALQTLDWLALHWELSLDGQPIDVKAFGVYDFVQPDLAPSPSPIRETFRHAKAWDVILVNPTPGAHTLSGMAADESETYTWTINFAVKASEKQ